MPIGARLRRLIPSQAQGPEPASAAIISRQRVIGPTNGSSTYLLSLANEIAKTGLQPRLIVPSPVMFGRWPALKLKPQMRVFGAIAVRRGVRVGDLILSTEPWRYWSAARAVLGRALAKAGLTSAAIEGVKAPYAIGAPWTDADRLFVARHAPAHLAAMIADYAFLTEAFPYLIAPKVKSAVIMHDLFHARAESLESRQAADGVAVLSEVEERRLLAQAQAVIAIQKAEAAYVRKALPRSEVILAPMAAEAAVKATAGRHSEALFVGSSTHPNVVGLQWLFDAVWPKVLAACPGARLTVAGSVDRAFSAAPAGVDFVGVVPDLAPLYREAGIVVSPLIVGSGLKIKLVEAMAQGKAIVATGVTLQGVEQEAGPGVRLADDPDAFAAAMVELMGDEAARTHLAERALGIARDVFGPAVAYADFRTWLLASSASA